MDLKGQIVPGRANGKERVKRSKRKIKENVRKHELEIYTTTRWSSGRGQRKKLIHPISSNKTRPEVKQVSGSPFGGFDRGEPVISTGRRRERMGPLWRGFGPKQGTKKTKQIIYSAFKTRLLGTPWKEDKQCRANGFPQGKSGTTYQFPVGEEERRKEKPRVSVRSYWINKKTGKRGKRGKKGKRWSIAWREAKKKANLKSLRTDRVAQKTKGVGWDRGKRITRKQSECMQGKGGGQKNKV